VLLITPTLIADVANARDALDEIRRKMPALESVMPPKAKPAAGPGATPEAPKK
jgi:hypothetical protein